MFLRTCERKYSARKPFLFLATDGDYNLPQGWGYMESHGLARQLRQENRQDAASFVKLD